MGNLWFELTGEYYKSVKKLESTEKNINFYKFSDIVFSQNLLQLGKGGVGLYAKAGEMST